MRQLKPATMRRLLQPNLGGAAGLPIRCWAPNPNGGPMVLHIYIDEFGYCHAGSARDLASAVMFAKATRDLTPNFFNGG